MAEFTERARTFFVENLNLKLVSLGFALVLYALVHGSIQEAQRSMYIDFMVLPPPDSANRILVSPLPPRVRLMLKGSRAALDELHADDIGNLQVDVHTGTEKRITLDPKNVHVPTGVRVEQIDPPFVDLVWEDQVVSDVPIQVGVVGTPAQGFVVKGVPLIDPHAVRARGPKSEVAVLQFARTEAFDVTGLSEGSYARQLKIDKPSGRVGYDTDAVKVTVDITREIAERPFTKLAVAVVGPPKAKTQPAEVDVRLICPPEILRGLRTEQVVPRVEVKQPAQSGSVALPVEVSVDKCEAQVTPSTVVVKW
jgi:hypothetical protein